LNPLDQLRGLHLPPQPGYWPPAPGWWLVALILAAGLATLIWFAIKRYRSQQYRRIALKQLAALQTGDNPLQGTLELVRRVAKTTCPESIWPSMSSMELLTRLDNFSNAGLTQALGDTPETLSSLLYRPGHATLTHSQQQILKSAVSQWLRKHRKVDLC
jgi:Domain of unknown function (DUF4381)